MNRRRRLDAELVRRGLARSREHAAELVTAGRVEVRGVIATKSATGVDADTPLRVVDDAADPGYVSRGAHKLAGALDGFGRVHVVGRRCLDAGASTGGFTDVLIRRGAREVVAVDVGYGQLAWSLRTDARVHVVDRTNVRDLDPDAIGGPAQLTVADLSFIPLRLVLPALAACTTGDGDLLPMVKPQFEVGRERLGRGGVVRDPRLHARGGPGRGGPGGGAGVAGGGGVPQSAARPVGQHRVLPVAAPYGGPGGLPARPGSGRAGGPAGRRERRRRADGGDAMRSALVVAHAARGPIGELTSTAASHLHKAGFEVRMLAAEAEACGCGSAVTVVEEADAARDVEIVLVFGGDGTFLRAAEFARPARAPMLGVNLGHVGFLAEAEPEELLDTVAAVADARYTVEERTTIDVVARCGDEVLGSTWALNEASVEKAQRERMLEVGVAIDGLPLLRFGCDGILCATPTGSTAYAYSAGGPIVWPSVDALLVVPNAAHALFSRPVVVAPQSVITLDLLREHAGVLSCDGRRTVALPPGAQVSVRRGALPVRIARLADWNFGERLVTKFQLPVRGFRDGAGERARRGRGPTPMAD